MSTARKVFAAVGAGLTVVAAVVAVANLEGRATPQVALDVNAALYARAHRAREAGITHEAFVALAAQRVCSPRPVEEQAACEADVASHISDPTAQVWRGNRDDDAAKYEGHIGVIVGGEAMTGAQVTNAVTAARDWIVDRHCSPLGEMGGDGGVTDEYNSCVTQHAGWFGERLCRASNPSQERGRGAQWTVLGVDRETILATAQGRANVAVWPSSAVVTIVWPWSEAAYAAAMQARGLVRCPESAP